MTFLTTPFLTLAFAIADIAPLVVALDVAGIALMLFGERMEPRTFVLWLMIILVFPVGGFILYLMFGCTMYSRHVFGRKMSSDSETIGIPEPFDGRCEMSRTLAEAGADASTPGNLTHAYWHATDSAEDILESIRRAEKSVYVECRTAQSDGLFGSIASAMAERAADGLDVRLLTGTMGFGRTGAVRRVRSAGGTCRTFHNPLYSMLSIKNSNRALRFLVVVDGRDAYTGRDTLIRVRGPAAARLEARFMADWNHSARTSEIPPPRADPGYPDGSEVQIVCGGPDQDGSSSPVVSMYSAIISSAERTLYISMPYLVPDENMYNTLKLARLSGVDVRILVPRRGRHWYQSWNSLSASNPMMMVGVRVYFTMSGVNRCMAVADGRVCMIGSAAFNTNSMTDDFTVSAVVHSEELARTVEREFMDELAGGVECLPEDYRGRTFTDMLKVTVARLMMFLN